MQRDQAQAPARQEAWWWPSGCGRSPVSRHRMTTGARPIQLSGPGKLGVPVAGASDVARVYDPPCLRVHHFEAVAPVVIAEIQREAWARLTVHFSLPRDAMIRRLAEWQNRHRRAAPENTLWGGSMPLFAVVAERLKPSEAHKTDSIHRLAPSGSRTPLSWSRCTSGKSLFTSRRATCPALSARDSPLSTGPFCCSVYGAVSSRRIWRLLQYSTNFELVYSVPLSVRNAHGSPMSAKNRCTTPRKWRMRSCRGSRMGAGSEKRCPRT